MIDLNVSNTYSGPYRWDEAKERIPGDFGIPQSFTDEEARAWNKSYPARRDAGFPSKEVQAMKDEEFNLDQVIF